MRFAILVIVIILALGLGVLTGLRLRDARSDRITEPSPSPITEETPPFKPGPPIEALELQALDTAGTVTHFRRDGEETELKQSDLLVQGETVVLEQDADATLTIPEIGRLEASDSAEIDLFQLVLPELVFVQKSGDVRYQATAPDVTISVRIGVALVTLNQGEMVIRKDGTESVIENVNGRPRVGLENSQGEIEIFEPAPGEQVVVDDSTHTAELNNF